MSSHACKTPNEILIGELVVSYVPELDTILVDDFDNPPYTGLCPFIAAHLEPSDRILPFHSLYLPTVPGYNFRLLYVLKGPYKEQHQQHTDDPNQYIATFLMNKPDRRQPILVGTVVTFDFIKKVRESVVEERKKLRLSLLEGYCTSEVKSSSV